MATNDSTTQPVNEDIQQPIAAVEKQTQEAEKAAQEAEKQKLEAEKAAQEAVKQSVKDMANPANIAKNMAEQEVQAAASRAISDVLPSEVNALRLGGLSAIPVIGPIIGWIGNIQWIASLLGIKKEEKKTKA